jgi:hypothetical protein
LSTTKTSCLGTILFTQIRPYVQSISEGKVRNTSMDSRRLITNTTAIYIYG